MASPLEEEYPRVIRVSPPRLAPPLPLAPLHCPITDVLPLRHCTLQLKSELETSLADVNYTAVAIARQSAADDRQQQQRVGAAPSVAKQQHLAGLVNALGRQRDQLRQTLRSANLNPQQRSTWTRRLDKLDRDCALLNHSVEKAVGYIAREMVAEQQHADLLDSGGSRLRDRVSDPREATAATILLLPRVQRRNMEVEALVAEERNRLDDTSAALDSMIAQGKATIDNLLHQKGYLKVSPPPPPHTRVW